MATIAETYSASRAAKAPISAHPAFPAIVALWFAALLGLGSLVLPVALIERLVTATGIATVLPAAEPPLGFTARAGIALGASIAGAIVGLLLARKVAAASAPAPTVRSFSVASERRCRPISAPDELGEEGLDSPESAPSPLMQKRRSLAMAEDNRPSTYLQAVPLPGQSFENRSELPLSEEVSTAEPMPHAETAAEADCEPLELGAFTAPEDDLADQPIEAMNEDGLEALRRRIHTPDAPAFQDSPMTDQTFHRAPSGDADCDAPMPQAYEPHAAQGDPLPFAAPSLRRSLTDVFDEEEQADVTQDFAGYEQEDDEALADEAAPQLTIVEAGCEPDVDDRPVDELGLVQLAARLGASIEKRRAWLAGRQTSVPPAIPPLAPFGDAEDFEAAAPEDAARGIADFFGPAGSVEQHDVTPSFAAPVEQPESDAAPAVVPQALRGIPTDHYDDEDEDALAASFSLPLEGIHSEPDDPFDAEDDQFDEQEPDDGEYSSLLAMKNPFARQQEFVRVEEPEDESRSIEPAVTFPSSSPAAVEDEAEDRLQAPASRPFDPPKNPAESALRSALPAAPRDPGDAERSLRDALATLQRMSGAA